jgi:plasmid stabilization system protein ParE
MIVEYHPLAALDFNNAISYYNRQRPNLGNEFRSEVSAAIERVRSNPLQFPIIDHNIRRAFTHRFPYSVLFRVIDEDTVRVLVIRHHRRNPSFGLTRR